MLTWRVEIFDWTLGPLPILVIGVVLFLGLAFFIWYWIPSRRIKKSLKHTLRAIQQLGHSSPVPPERIGELIQADDRLKNLWREYAETLHRQYDLQDGEKRLIAVRATLPAETFFSSQALVDIPLNTEFFRHLPGILTGIGIIGTFSGLILGLRDFNPTGSAEAVKESLGQLMHGVMEAFMASAIAIACAMVVTFVEKSILNRRYKQAEELAQAIDGLYQAGVGEEYLARLVDSSERNAVHVAQLKQSLVEDLRQILIEVSESQANQVSFAIRQSLQEPLQQIANIVQVASGQQGTAVQALLEDLLAAFLERLEGVVGHQLQSLSGALTQTTQVITCMGTGIDTLIEKMAETGRQNAEILTGKVRELLQQAEVRQRELAERAQERHQRLEGVVEELLERNDRLAETMRSITGDAITRMNEAAQTMRAAALEFGHAGGMIQATLDELNTAGAGLRVAVQALQPTVEQIVSAQAQFGQTTEQLEAISRTLAEVIAQAKKEASLSSQLISKFEQAADQLSQASQESSQYLEKVNGVLKEAFQAFHENLIEELKKTQAAFNSELDRGVKILQAALSELAALLEQTSER